MEKEGFEILEIDKFSDNLKIKEGIATTVNIPNKDYLIDIELGMNYCYKVLKNDKLYESFESLLNDLSVRLILPQTLLYYHRVVYYLQR